MNFADRLNHAIREKQSCTVVGLDPDVARLPAAVRDAATGSGRERLAAAVLAFGKRILDIVAPLVPAVKPQVAYYERLGWAGVRAFEETVAYAHAKGLLVIGDVKRGDIGSTARAYAFAHLGGDPDAPADPAALPDAVTVNPLFGTDGVAPFIEQAVPAGRGVFVLVRTSNPSSVEIQGEGSDPSALSRRLAARVAAWGADAVGESGYSAVGAVVGATFPEDARVLRAAMPHAIFLVPGFGAQGAGVADVAPNFRPDGLGAVVNSSRGIIFACTRPPWDRQFGARRWEEAVEAATRKMNDDLRPLLTPTPA
jgi:orotidine-5'-phosphate decarboxylase